MRLSLWVLAALAALIFPVHAEAATRDALLDGARLCTRLLPSYERQYKIPKYLLTAIAVTESGRWHAGLGTSVPWPWTVNAEGKGHYFATKDEAMEFVRDLRRKGVKSMDVGCMQVNLYHHQSAFANLSQAFDPNSNIRYAAQFLRDNYTEARSWKRAAAAYHSKTPELGGKYATRVHKSWKNIIAHVRKKQGNQSANTASMAAPMGEFDVAANTQDTYAERRVRRHSPMKVIEIKSGEAPENDATATHVENGVKVTRATPVEPEPAAIPLSLASVAPPSGAVPGASNEVAEAAPIPTPQPKAVASAATPAPKVISVHKNGETTTHTSGPRFIFD